jgi:hypothetical protein
LYAIGPSGLSTASVFSTHGVSGGLYALGTTVASAGDVDGDGFGDVLVGEPAATFGIGEVILYRGGPSGLDPTAGIALGAPSRQQGAFGSAMTSTDVDGDGFSDVVISAPNVSTHAGAVYVFRGGATGLSSMPDFTLRGASPNVLFGTAIAASDFDGDGFGDLVVGAPGGASGRVFVFRGSATGPSSSPDLTLSVTDGAGFGSVLARAGDIDGDGFSDVLIGSPGSGAGAGLAFVYRGASTLAWSTPDATIMGAPGTGFATAFGAPDDVDGNHLCDITIGLPHASADAGSFEWFAGASPIATTPTAVVPAPAMASGRFGAALGVR